MSDAREGQGPPKDITASEIYLALTAMPVPHEVADFPIKDPVFGKPIGQVAIVPLSPEERMICLKVAGDWATKMTGEKPENGKESPSHYAIMASEMAVQVLWRALRDPNDKTLKKPAIPTAKLLREAPFTDDIHVVLMKMYNRTCVVCGPIVAEMTPEEMDAWLDALEEGGAGFPLEVLSGAMKSDLLMRSVARLKSSKTGSGSSGPQTGEPIIDEPKLPPSEQPPTPPDSEQPPSVSADELVIPPSA